MSGARGLIAYFMDLGTATWQIPANAGKSPKRRYGQRQRSQASGGKVAFIRLDTDGVYTVRYTGTWQNFLDNILRKAKAGKIIEAWTQSGTEAAQQFVG